MQFKPAKPDTWHLEPDTWHLTPDIWHLTPTSKIQYIRLVNIVSKFKVFSSALEFNKDIFTKDDLINEWISDKGVCGTALDTKGSVNYHRNTIMHGLKYCNHKIHKIGCPIACASTVHCPLNPPHDPHSVKQLTNESWQCFSSSFWLCLGLLNLLFFLDELLKYK